MSALTRSAVLALAMAGAVASGAGAAAVTPRDAQLPKRHEPWKRREQRAQQTPEPAPSRQQPPIAISVDSGRPMSKAIDVLVERFHWIVTYEDPRYLAPQDIADVTISVRKDGRSEPKVLVPRAGPLAFEYELPTAGGPPDPAAVLNALISAHDTYGYAADFRLIQTGDVFHVVPRAARSAAGFMEEAGSLLDVRISIPDRPRTLYEAMQDVVHAVGSASGERVQLGMFPMNLATQTKVSGGAQNEPARAVLLRAFSAARLRLSWRLYYGPGDDRYVLNVHIVDPDSIRSRANR